MKKIGSVVLLLLVGLVLCISFTQYNVSAEEHLTAARSAVLMERDSRRVLYAQNENERLPMASTTKIMTALVVAENCQPDEIVTVDKKAVGIEGSSLYLKEGQRIPVCDLLSGLMLRSGNDSAVALAIHTAGSAEKFVQMMNDRATSIGAVNTHFANPHGLHDNEHYTSAYDLALISAQALSNDLVRRTVAQKSAVLHEDDSAINIYNKNKLLSMLPDADGVKTGYTTKAGRCFVGSATRNGMQLIVVVLNCSPMFENSRSMLEWGFSNYTMTNIVPYNKPYKPPEKGARVYFCPDEFSYPLKSDGSENTLIKKSFEKLPDGEGYCLNIYLDKQLIFSRKMVTI